MESLGNEIHGQYNWQAMKLAGHEIHGQLKSAETEVERSLRQTSGCAAGLMDGYCGDDPHGRDRSPHHPTAETSL